MEILENKMSIEERIFSIRGKQVILDRDLAKLYEVDVAQMNRQVKRNIERFPDDFMFQLNSQEWKHLKCHFGISNTKGGDRALPYAFTEQGVSMLAGLLRSPVAIEANIRIIHAYRGQDIHQVTRQVLDHRRCSISDRRIHKGPR